MTQEIQMDDLVHARKEEKERCQKRLESKDKRIKKLKDQLDLLDRIDQRDKSGNEDEINQLKEELEEKNNHLKHSKDDLQEKLSLVSNILSVTVSRNIEVDKFKLLLTGESLDLLNNTSLSKLNRISVELEQLINFPLMYHKNIVAIGGGFSSGKSAFISNFFEDSEIELPIGINPMTAIPTYIASEGHSEINGYTYDGGKISIDKKTYAKLSHDFIKTFDFNLKKIMPYMSISTPLQGYNTQYKHLCFIDTPGYDPANTGTTKEDVEISSRYIGTANSLIWLIGLDSNGTIPASDIAFLKSLNLGDKRLYIVANKADLKPREEVNEIMKQIYRDLSKKSISICGISAFSSNTKEPYGSAKLRLSGFLNEENHYKKDQIKNNILSDLDKVIQDEKKLAKDEIKKMENASKELHTLQIDIFEQRLESLKLDKIKHFFKSEKIYTDKIKQLDSLYKQMNEQIETVLKQLEK